jgi:hypothetical protein
MSRCVTLAVALTLLAAVVPAPAAAVTAIVVPAQSDSYPGVEELWEEYPLDEERGRERGDGESDPSRDTTPAPAPGETGPAEPADDRDDRDVVAADQDHQPATLTVAAAGGGTLLALLAVALLTRRRSRRRRGQEVPYALSMRAVRNVYAEGFTARDGIGAFAGFVHAVAVGPDPKGDEMLCLDDPHGESALWVRRSEVTALRTVEAAGGIQEEQITPKGAADVALGSEAQDRGAWGRPGEEMGEARSPSSRFVPASRTSHGRSAGVPSGRRAGSSGRRRP